MEMPNGWELSLLVDAGTLCDYCYTCVDASLSPGRDVIWPTQVQELFPVFSSFQLDSEREFPPLTV